MKRLISVMLAMVMVFMIAGLASAQDMASEKFYISPEFGVYGTSQKDVNSIITYGGSAGYFIFDNFSVGVEANGYYADLDNRGYYDPRGSSANGFGFNALVRFYLFKEDPFRLYVGTGFGGLFMDEDLTYGGESSSFTLPVDLGMTINFTKNIGLDVGGRYQRIGFTEDGVDAWGGHASLRFMF